MVNTENFFAYLFGSEHIRFRCLMHGEALPPIDAHGYYNREVINVLQQANNQNREVYYVANIGGYKNHQITSIKAVFVDLDCGRDENGDYFPLDVVELYKKDRFNKLNSFIFKPTFIIETRNGLQAVWALNDGATLDQFIECEGRLIQYFGADPSVRKPAQLLRVPGYNWCKDKNNKYLCEIVSSNDVRYNINDIIECLFEYTDTPIIKPKGISKPAKPTVKNSNNNIDLIRNRDVEGLRIAIGLEDVKGKIDLIKNLNSTIPFFNPVRLTNRDELYDYIFKINLLDFLGLHSNNFSCIFHNDKSPSASIFISEDDGHYLYKCHSSKCGFTGNIIRCVERLQGCNKPQAINFIKTVYGLELQESDWQKEQKELLQLNKDYLYSDLLQVEYPELYRLIKNYIPLLIFLNDVAMNNVYDVPLGDSNKVVFFSSTSRLKKLSGATSNDKVNKRINLFALLELIEKLPEDSIPKRLRDKAVSLATKARIASGAKHWKYTSFYSIPSYCDKVLSHAEHMAKVYRDKHMTQTGWSWELLYRNFGAETANKVYTQGERKLSQESMFFTTQFDTALMYLINEHGYATEKQIIQVLGKKESTLKPFIKRVLNESLEKYNLTIKKLNKNLKLKFGITDIKGYPYIIVPKE